MSNLENGRSFLMKFMEIEFQEYPEMGSYLSDL